jgi:hypothetical protein
MNNWKEAALDALHIACYQHACLLYENNLNLTNKTHLQIYVSYIPFYG